MRATHRSAAKRMPRLRPDPATLVAGKAQMAQLGLHSLYEFVMIPAIVANMTPTASLVESVRSNPNVDYLEPDVTGGVSSQVTPWNLSRVQAPQAWPYSTGSGVKLLIIDTGVTLQARSHCWD